MEAVSAAKTLRTGATVSANQRSLHPDLAEGVILGTDEYGCDVMFSERKDSADGYIERAVKWLLAKPDPKRPHPAEFCA
jgi:hypothetical protein